MSSGEFTLRAVSKVYDARAALSDVSLTITRQGSFALAMRRSSVVWPRKKT